MPVNIGIGTLPLVHAIILSIDIVTRYENRLKEPGGCRVIFSKLLVGQYMLGIGYEAEVFAIGHCCVGILLLWQCRKGHLKPDHILSGHQCRTDIIRRPGVIKYWLARLKRLNTSVISAS